MQPRLPKYDLRCVWSNGELFQQAAFQIISGTLSDLDSQQSNRKRKACEISHPLNSAAPPVNQLSDEKCKCT